MRTNTPHLDLRQLDDPKPIIAPALDPSPETESVYETSGPFEIRLASGGKDLKQVQRLRYKVFYDEGRAVAAPSAARVRLDLCPFDAICDHLLVVDREAQAGSGRHKPKIVGTYRLLRRDVADRHNGFYSQSEFDLAPMLARHPDVRFLELGRSCVHGDYRSRRVVELLWRGLWLYAQAHRIDVLVGCASLPGTDLEALRLQLSFLTGAAALDERWQVDALPHCAARFEPVPPQEIDTRRAVFALPPLIKAYLRTGARFARTAVTDHQFGTTDVFTVMPMRDIEERYLDHYGTPSCTSEPPVA